MHSETQTAGDLIEVAIIVSGWCSDDSEHLRCGSIYRRERNEQRNKKAQDEEATECPMRMKTQHVYEEMQDFKEENRFRRKKPWELSDGMQIHPVMVYLE